MKKRRLLSIVISLCMVLALMPQMVFAEGDDTSELQNLLNDGGTVTLEKDYTITSSLQVDKKTVTLDLNGHVIKISGTDHVIKVINGANLTLQDSSPKTIHIGEYVSLPAGGVITNNKSDTGSGVYVDESSFTMNGGTISDCSAGGSGGGVCVRNKGSFIMNNGAISSCRTAGSGGGVYVDESSFTMNGGTISDCSAGGACGGIEILEESSFTMNGGTISDCRGLESGAANAFDSTIFANGGTIKDKVALYDSHIKNTATYGGTVFYGGISIFNSSNIIGKTITFKKDDNPYAIEIVAEGSNVAKPIEPTKEDYEFAGWYDENDTKYDFTQDVTQDIVLTAQWEGKEAPVIKGLEKNKTYCDAVEFEVTDNVGVVSVTANGVTLTPDANNKYTLGKGTGTVTVVAIDKANNQTSVTVTVNNGHTGGTATCIQKAKCGICGEEYGELANHSLSKTEAKAASCTENGNSEYWTCTVCKKMFSDENGTTETTQDAVTIRANGHTLNKTDAKEATAAETGNIEYWQCENCKECFSDKDGKNSIEFADTVISKRTPEIIEGAGQRITAGEKKVLSFTSNAAYSDFIRVELDGSELSEEYYEKAEGSIIITLDADYVATLPAGEHTIGIVSTSGTAETTFTVAEKVATGTADDSDNDSKSDEDSVKTGDNANLALWLALMLLSGAGITGVTAYTRRKRTNE